MMEPRHDETKMNFQVERFITFSDGFFAIVITIMVFELRVPEITKPDDVHLLNYLKEIGLSVKVPELPKPNDLILWEHLKEMGLKFLGFLISFGIVGHYWSVHHRIYGYALKYTTALLWINLGFLLTVAVLPFSSALLGEYASHYDMHLPYAMYVLNICLVAFMNIWMWLYISNPKKELLTRKISAARIKLGVYRSLVIPLIFLLSFVVSLVTPFISRVMLLLIPVILLWGMAPLEKLAELQEIPVLKQTKEKLEVREDDSVANN